MEQGKSGREEHGQEKPQQQRQQQQPGLRKSCDYCARMKRACDGGSPCALCSRRGKVCERRLRRKSGPAKGAKYAPRRRKFDSEAAALAEEEAAAAAEAAATVASLKDKERNRGGFNKCGGGGGGYGDALDSSGVSRSSGGDGGGRGGAAAVAVAMKPVRRIQGRKTREENDRPPSGGGGSPPATFTSPATATATPPPAGRPPVLKTEEARSTSPQPQPQPQPQPRNQELWRKRGRGEKRGSSCSDDSSSTSTSSGGSAESPSWSRGVPRKRRFPSKGWTRAAGRGGDERALASPSGDSCGRTWQASDGDERASGGVGVDACGGGGGGEIGRESSRRNENSSSSGSSSGSSEAPCYSSSSSAAAAAPVSCYNNGPAEDLRPTNGGSRPYSPKVVARVPRRDEGAEEEEEEEEGGGVSQRNRYVDRHHPPERQASTGGDVETTTRSTSSGTGWTAAAAAAAAAAATRATSQSPAAVAGEAVEQGGRRCRPLYPKQEVRDDVDYTAGRVVSVSPLKKTVTGEGGDEEGPDHQGGGGGRGREKDRGRDSSPPRVQAWEPTVEAAGIGLDVGSYAGRAAGLRNLWAGSLRPKEQQPLAPKDLLLMLRPNSEGFFDCGGAEKKGGTQATHIKGGGGGWGGGGAAAAATKMAVSVVGGGGGGDEGDRRSSWSDSREACREAGELLRAIRRDSAPAATAADTAAATTAAVAPSSSPKHAGGGGDRGERNNVPGDLEQGRRWREAERRLPEEGHGGSGGGGDTDYGYVESFTSNRGRFDHVGQDGRLPSILPFPGLALRECHREYFHRAHTTATAAAAGPVLQPSHRIPPGGYPYNRSQDHHCQARSLPHPYRNHASTTTTRPLHEDWNDAGRRSPAVAAPPSFAQVVLATHPPFPGGGGTGDQRDSSGGRTGTVSSERCWKGGRWSVPAALSGRGHHGGPSPISIPVPVPDHHTPPPAFGRVGGPFREGNRGARS